MRKKLPALIRCFLSAALLCLGILVQAQDAWQHLPGPSGALVIDLEEDGGRVYALCTGGIYISDTEADQWTMLPGTRALGPEGVQLEVSNGVLYVLNSQNKLLRSTDAGQHWTPVLQQPFPLPAPGEKLLRIFASGDTVLVGSLLTIYRSLDRGEHWEFTAELYNQRFQNFARIEQDFFACTDRFIWKSGDGGLNWQKVFSAGFNFAAMTAIDTFLYGLYDGFPRLIRSVNRGLNWQLIDSDSLVTNWPYSRDFPDWLVGAGNDIIAVSDFGCVHGGVWFVHSPDQGDEWVRTSKTGMIESGIRDVMFTDGKLFAGTFNGIFRSDDIAITFQRKNEGLDAASVQEILKTGSGRWWVRTDDEILSSDDEGLHWTVRKAPPEESYCFRHLGLSFTPKRIFFDGCPPEYSEDNGETRQPIPFDFPLWSDCASFASAGDTAFMLHNDNLYYWSDDDTEIRLMDLPPGNTTTYILSISTDDNRLLVNGLNQNLVWEFDRSTWDAIPPLQETFPSHYDEFMDSDRHAYYARSGIDGSLYRWSFSEKIWSPYIITDPIYGDTIDARKLTLFENTGDIRWLGISGRGLYYCTVDDPFKVYAYAPPLPHPYPRSVYLDDKKLWVGTLGGGIYTHSIRPQQPDVSTPEFKLYPNPSFGAVQWLESDIFWTEPLRLELFDMAGRLLSAQTLHPGSQWRLATDQFPTGVYVYRVYTPGGMRAMKWVR
jgi:photosystem II stability/assembly factor-like uncharacterized protein